MEIVKYDDRLLDVAKEILEQNRIILLMNTRLMDNISRATVTFNPPTKEE